VSIGVQIRACAAPLQVYADGDIAAPQSLPAPFFGIVLARAPWHDADVVQIEHDGVQNQIGRPAVHRCRIRPQLGSEAEKAVLTTANGQWYYATLAALGRVPACSTSMVINLVAPSPSRTQS